MYFYYDKNKYINYLYRVKYLSFNMITINQYTVDCVLSIYRSMANH